MLAIKRIRGTMVTQNAAMRLYMSLYVLLTGTAQLIPTF